MLYVLCDMTKLNRDLNMKTIQEPNRFAMKQMIRLFDTPSVTGRAQRNNSFELV